MQNQLIIQSIQNLIIIAKDMASDADQDTLGEILETIQYLFNSTLNVEPTADDFRHLEKQFDNLQNRIAPERFEEAERMAIQMRTVAVEERVHFQSLRKAQQDIEEIKENLYLLNTVVQPYAVKDKEQ